MKLRIAGLAIAIALGTAMVACEKDDSGTPDLRSKTYNLSAVGASGVTGTVRITENSDRSFNLELALAASVKDTVHISHIHSGSISNPGPVAIPLASITGTGGAAQAITTNINTITYDSLLNLEGYINVHYSAFNIDSLVAQTNIGKNAP